MCLWFFKMLPTEPLEQSDIWHVFFFNGCVFFCWICVWDQSISLFFGVWKVHMQISTPFYFPLFPLSALRPWVFMRWRAMERQVGLLSVIKQQCPTNTTTQINIQNITVQIWLSLQLHRSLNLLHVFVLHQLGNISGSYIYNYNPDDTNKHLYDNKKSLCFCTIKVETVQQPTSNSIH